MIGNLSSTETMSARWKAAIVSPLLKKASLDPEILKNFKPVSNIDFISKLIEKVIAQRFLQYIRSNNLDELYQSAYKPAHSAETALLRVQNDILCAVDQHQAIALVLLDLSAAFNTIDHAILLQRLSYRCVIHGKRWFKSYLYSRTQRVCIQGTSSEDISLMAYPRGRSLDPSSLWHTHHHLVI